MVCKIISLWAPCNVRCSYNDPFSSVAILNLAPPEATAP